MEEDMGKGLQMKGQDEIIDSARSFSEDEQFEDALTIPKLSAVRDSEIFDGVTGENFNAG
ncbi:hypothetical protein RhiirA5_422685 [Rhizophagus irregularis]|uniref:Uncharacterized protein n=1 Tax=Rhizophagus irregularis TaxID=588596 RepID=A0A2N0PBE2_9GLOM|nr:hypothetical protein RhiirA5_422685 [Rhizophagus irregularis]